MLQWRRPGTSTWKSRRANGDMRLDAINSAGNYKIVTRAKRTLVYRVVLPRYPGWWEDKSAAVRVKVR